MGIRKKTEWTEERILNMLRGHFLSSSTKKYEMFNFFVYDWESDYLCITQAGYVYECEVKISRADFKNDKKKENKHLILEGKVESLRPNYFYYAVPDGLISPDEVPENCGLIYVKPWGITVVKDAPILRKEKSDINELNLPNKFYYSYWSWRDKCTQNDITEMKNTIKNLEKDILYYDNELSLKQNRIEELEKEIEDLKKNNK